SGPAKLALVCMAPGDRSIPERQAYIYARIGRLVGPAILLVAAAAVAHDLWPFGFERRLVLDACCCGFGIGRELLETCKEIVLLFPDDWKCGCLAVVGAVRPELLQIGSLLLVDGK